VKEIIAIGREQLGQVNLTNKESTVPANQIPHLLSVSYEGTHKEPYTGTGIGETEGWMFRFNDPRGTFQQMPAQSRKWFGWSARLQRDLGQMSTAALASHAK